ncbi:formate-dependent phosphoribosylglycinamide formyltransferase [Massilia sp. PAMC28688]|uniref:formate-dependent phosphoribosylglycinamide formyltransferase n=1 Tax=Massilia sp. PAMC28688 TaxID=2861283 RepID=UPI001C63043B|nr:formate-dependent phosphoribosylglycinamide formyltransferase [Massilia sp. PAMC28688]QYF94331.1 formate-dependent phosphoribosylglycinamide formyltransferase [Massilia sp. PAMC28688]
MNIGTAHTALATKVILLGCGELGKEIAIEFMRLGVEVIACDSYANAPAMQVANRSHIVPLLDGAAVRAVVALERPHYIVSDTEAIAVDQLLLLETELPDVRIVPTARALAITADRESIRRLAAEQLGLSTAKYAIAETAQALAVAAHALGFPCVVKPVKGFSRSGQSIVGDASGLADAWQRAQAGNRGISCKVIVEEFVPFQAEITLLTVRAANGTFFCAPIGHRQEGGDYVASWQPHQLDPAHLEKAQQMAAAVTAALGGYGIFGVELFLLENGDVYFNEVGPRPHDTGMVTVASQLHSEFALHVRAILGLPVTETQLASPAANVVFRADTPSEHPVLVGVERLFATPGVDFRFFGKPKSYARRIMGTVLARDTSAASALEKAGEAAKKIALQ